MAITTFSVISQNSPKEWAKHFDECRKSLEYAGDDAVMVSKDGKCFFYKEIDIPNVDKNVINKRAKLIIKNFLSSYLTEYITEDEISTDTETKAPRLLSQLSGKYSFSTKWMSCIYHYQLKYRLEYLAEDGKISIWINNLMSSTTVEAGGQGAGRMEDYTPAPLVGEYVVNQKKKEVKKDSNGFRRVGYIDLKKTIFQTFEENIVKNDSELNVSDNW